jgi:hypothetical protein
LKRKILQSPATYCSKGERLGTVKSLQNSPAIMAAYGVRNTPVRKEDIMKNVFSTTTSVVFSGVNPGYMGEEVAVTNSTRAAELVTSATTEVGITARVYPGRVVYHTDWGCPQGGEACAAVLADGEAGPLVPRFDNLRRLLRQTTLSVAAEGGGTPTIGFTADIGEGDLDEVARLWQVVAAEKFVATGTYVSGGVFAAEGRVFAAAEANPAFVSDRETWADIVRQVTSAVSPTAEVTFREVGFTYLRPKVYFGFAVADGMFRGDAVLRRTEVSPEEAKKQVEEASHGGWLFSTCNPAHVPTIAAMRSRYGLDVPAPEKAPHVTLERGDVLVVMSVRGLPRLQDGRHEYTEEEVASATFSFAKWVREE